MIPVQLLDAFMAKKDEQHVSGELSRVEEAGTEDATSTSTDGKTSTSTDITTSTSTDITTSTSTDITTSTSIDGSTQKSTDVSSCDLIPNVDIKITMEDFLELEDEAQPENLDHNLEKKLDEYQHTSEKDLETSKASIGRHQPDEIDRQPPHIIDLHPPDIDRHRQPLIDRHHTLNIDRCPLLDVPPCCIIEMEPIEERTNMSKASHLAIVVPCAVVEVESPIPPDRSMQLSHYIGVLDDPLHAEASQRGDRDTTTRSDKSGGKKRRNWKKGKRIKNGPQVSLTPHFSDCVRKSRVRGRCFSHPFAKLRALLLAEMIDKGEESMEEAFTQE
ncbi:hypothetical protein DY000_02040934 [Brassica cretica]|uniref:Uncharacterized protein n=1 Tax=Brassica cretica TaxID=69181 RepID=A0ABQ7B4S9_BRACR|nr:hypothetical protein DY000_02040934 [Brassica cretica]